MKHSRLYTLLAIISLCTTLPACVPLVAAGVGATGVASTLDRRSYGVQIQDSEIERRFNHNFPVALEENTQVSANAFNRWILLTGRANNEKAKADVEQLARNVPNIREVFNEIAIGYPLPFGVRTSDRWVVTQVKARLVDSKEISANHFDVICSNGVVYLMGIVTENEANIATEIARTTKNVVRVVRVMEVVSPAEIARLTGETPAPVSNANGK
ncbi:BON domain-containing protein [Uliginosibacterium gangwonense]|uniref:BON domain-containing protein n=1 Tax=Uliginosibacterium gangwonense TaxID=392736 RepID=UPI0003804243|nr:BON domain-containing protein [Uliginosibacterium gangwonense]